MIRACCANKCALAICMRRSTVTATPGWLTRPHKQRRGVPNPGHQDGKSNGEYHLGTDELAKHVVVFLPERLAFLMAWVV